MKLYLTHILLLTVIIVTITGCSDKQIPMVKPNQNDIDIGVVSESQRKEMLGITLISLKNALKMELTAVEKYKEYSEIAASEGYINIEKLFRAMSRSEKIHADNHLDVIRELGENYSSKEISVFEAKNTIENLKDALSGETDEVEHIYPDFIELTKHTGLNSANVSFNYALKTEKRHKKFIEKSLKEIEERKEKDLPSEYYVCNACGNLYANNNIVRCEFSLTPSEKFIRIN